MTEKQVLNIKTIPKLQKLTWQDFADRDLTQKEFEHIYKLTDAFWKHSGNPKDPHAELTSGKCSNGYVDSGRALRYTNICQIMAHQSVRKLRQNYDGPIDWVVGSDHAAATYSFAVASFLNAMHDFTEKTPENTQAWKRYVIDPNQVVLQAEELMNTKVTVERVQQALNDGNPEPINYAPYILALLNRGNSTEVDGRPILNLFKLDISVDEPDDCPLCKQGSKRLRPKKNWAELTGK